MGKMIQTIGIFEEDDTVDVKEECFKDGTNPVSKKLKGADRTKKKRKASGTGKTLHRKATRKALMKTVKKQIIKHIRELNPTNVSLVSLSEAKCVVPHHESDLLRKDSEFCTVIVDSCHLFLPL